MTKRTIFLAVAFLLSAYMLGAAQPPTIASASINPNTSQITIKGASLAPTTGAPTVTLDGASLALVSYSQTQIIATVPAALGIGTFRLKVTADTLSGIFDVTNGAGVITLPFIAQDGTGPTAFTIVEQAPGAIGIYPYASFTGCGALADRRT